MHSVICQIVLGRDFLSACKKEDGADQDLYDCLKFFHIYFSIRLFCEQCKSLRQKVGKEYRNDCYRSNVTDKEPEDTEDLHIFSQRASISEFVIYVCLLEPPSDEEDSHETT